MIVIGEIVKEKLNDKRNITFKTFYMNIQFAMYKRGLTNKMMAQLFNVSETYFDEVLAGKHADEKAKSIIIDLIIFF